MAHRFIDGVALNREHPDTFTIPSAQEKACIEPGDCVKVGFVTDDPLYEVERMWVEVESVEGVRIIGTLANEPTVLDAALGDRVTCEMRHVLDIGR